MVRTTCLTIFLLFISCSLRGQKIYDIEADLIKYTDYSWTFYKKSGDGTYYEQYPDFQETDEGGYEIYIEADRVRDTTEIYNGASKVISINSLPNSDFASFKRNLSGKIFMHKQEKVISEVKYFNEALFSARTFYMREGHDEKGRTTQKWEPGENQFFNYMILRVNQSRYIVQIIEYDEWGIEFIGSIVPEEEYSMFFDRSWLAEINKNSPEWTLLSESDKDYNYNDSEIYKVDSTYCLRNLVFNEPVLNEKFDSLYIKNGFVVGRKEGKYSIYNLKLENLTPQGVRAVDVNDDFCQVLRKNQLYWLNKSGRFQKKKDPVEYWVCGTVTYVDREIIADSANYIFKETVDGFTGDHVAPLFYNIAFKDEYDDILFLNSMKNLKFDGNSGLFEDYNLPDNPYNYLIVSKNGKQGLVAMDYDTTRTTELKTLLPPTFEEVRGINYYHPVLFTRNGLYGYYPLNETVRYKKIDRFEGFFARFELPDGTWGYLDRDGSEYLDE